MNANTHLNPAETIDLGADGEFRTHDEFDLEINSWNQVPGEYRPVGGEWRPAELQVLTNETGEWKEVQVEAPRGSKSKRPIYCTRPTVESCQICSLTNYGRDCQSNLIGPGRPAMYPDYKRRPRSFKATDKEWEQIQDAARTAGISASKWIRQRSIIP